MSLIENFSSTPIKELNLRTLIKVRPEDSIRSAIEKMREAGLGCVVAVDDNTKPVGMLTEGMLRQLIPRNPAVVDDTVGDHMATSFPWLALDDTVDMLVDALQANNTRFLCVVDAAGMAVALAGQKGLMEFIAEHFPRQVMVHRIGGTKYTESREGA